MIYRKNEKLILEALLELQFGISRLVREFIAGADAAADEKLDKAAAADAICAAGREFMLEFFGAQVAPRLPVVVVAEGLEGGAAVFAPGGREENAKYRFIIDLAGDIHCLLSGKRSAWSLAAAAPNLGPETSMQHIFIAAQTEISTGKQNIIDRLWALEKRGPFGERINLDTGRISPLRPKPSQATSIEHGFAAFCRFSPGVKDAISEIEEELVHLLCGSAPSPRYFEDQRISSGGHIYDLVMGHSRFVCDIRGLLAPQMLEHGGPHPLCCHPSGLCSEIIAREAGVIITPPGGKRLSNPLDTTANMSYLAYANDNIYALIGPAITKILRNRKLI